MPEKEKKSRFGRLLHKDQEKEEAPQRPPPDSAYASDGTPNVSQTSDISKLDNEKKLEAVSKDDNLSVKPTSNTTGDVVEKDTGDVVTTVTTTTTTTTTTTAKGGQKLKEEVIRDVQQSQSQPMTSTASTSILDGGISNRDSGISHRDTGILSHDTGISNRDSTVEGVSELSATPPEPHVGPGVSPPIPPKSPARREAEQLPPPPSVPGARLTPPPSPSRTGGHNFSYPSRAAPGPQGGQPPPVPQQQSTLQNLKAAAHGLHGAGETLRGTLNSSIDKRFALGSNPDKQADAVARHNDVAQRGMAEIDRAQFTSRNREPAPHVPPQGSTYPTTTPSMESGSGSGPIGSMGRSQEPYALRGDGPGLGVEREDVRMGGMDHDDARNDALSDIPEASREDLSSVGGGGGGVGVGSGQEAKRSNRWSGLLRRKPVPQGPGEVPPPVTVTTDGAGGGGGPKKLRRHY